jgi:hypothetical protein
LFEATLAPRVKEICCFKTAVLLNNNYVIIPCGPQYLFGPRLGYAREYGSVMVDQKIVSDHEKCAIFVIATEFRKGALGLWRELGEG